MHRALELAQGGLGWTSPNPMVGCVLVRNGCIVSEGWHQRNGAEHAEVLALRACPDPSGATAFVNLEPCNHVGRQPACCTELHRAGVTRVVYGSEDMNPVTRGAAMQWLPLHGVEVRAGVLQAECDRFLDYYQHSHGSQRVFIHLKLALSLDGKAACANGRSQWLSGRESLGLAHYLRQLYDGVLVSARTALADMSRLSVRPEQLVAYYTLPDTTPARQPVRIILDPRFELAERLAKLPLAEPGGNWRSHLPQIVLAGDKRLLPASDPVANNLRIVLLGLDSSATGQLEWEDLASRLRSLGLMSILVEGGPSLAAGLLRQRAADKITLVYTPRLLGADGIGFTPEMGLREVSEGIKIADVSRTTLGYDCVVTGYPV